MLSISVLYISICSTIILIFTFAAYILFITSLSSFLYIYFIYLIQLKNR